LASVTNEAETPELAALILSLMVLSESPAAMETVAGVLPLLGAKTFPGS
jgi:hypothetical protein